MNLSLPEQMLFFGKEDLRPIAGTKNFLFLGTTGSGKTLSIRLLMKRVIPYIREGRNIRAIIYDGKVEFVSRLAQMLDEQVIKGKRVGEKRLHLLNPFDSRCAAWNMAKDINEPAAALELAEILVPQNINDTNPFFREAARHVVYGVVLALIELIPEKWSFRDLLAILKQQDAIKEILTATIKVTGITGDIADTYFNARNQKLAGEIVATIRSILLPFEIIAGYWHKADYLVSLEEWLKSERGSILVLGSSEKTRVAVDAVNHLIYTRAVQLLLDEQDNDEKDPFARQVWFFLDEVRQMGKLNKLNSAMTKGRSKGACTVLGLQDIDGLISIYGKDLAYELLGMTSNKAILKLNSPSSAEWASSLWGDFRTEEEKKSTSISASENGVTIGESTSPQEKQGKAVLQSEFFKIKEPGLLMEVGSTKRTGLDAYYISSEVVTHPHGRWHRELGWESVLKGQPPKHEYFPNFAPHEPVVGKANQYLSNWTDDDRKRLGIVKTETPPKDKQAPPSGGQSSPPANNKTSPSERKSNPLLTIPKGPLRSAAR